MGPDALYMEMVIGVESFRNGKWGTRVEIRDAITWGGKLPADRAGTSRIRIRGRNVQNVGAGRVHMSHELA
jgi:hypothetical protein